MNKVYPERINWEDEPSVATPLSAGNLNKIDYATYEMDNRIIALDANKANQSDLLLDIKEVAYNPTTGVWTFTHQNGTTDTFDQNIEKIPVSFAMDENGVITMTTEDGTTYTCDVGTLIKTYTFVDSGNIQFTVTTDAQGNKSVTANIIDGSVTRAKLDPNLLSQIDVAVASASASAESAGISANTASSKALDSEAYAIGTRGGVPVTSEDPAYENNSKYYAEHGASSLAGLTDVNISGVTNGQVIKYNSTTQKWENDDESGGGGGILPHLIVISETGSTVTATKGQTVITATETSTGHFECDLTEFGTWTIDAILGGDDAQVSLVVDTVKVYTVDDSHFHATVTVKYPSGATCRLQSADETLYATGSPYTFTVHHKETYTITVTYNQRIYTDTVTFTTEGQSFSKTLPTPSEIDVINDIDIWLWYGDVSGTFTTLSDILGNSTALSMLMSSTDAVDYLVRCKEWISNDGLVPIMTSDTTPSGVASAGNVYGSNNAYKAFDDDDTTYWYTNVTDSTSWIQYEFENPVCAKRFKALITLASANTNYCPSGYTLSASNDGVNFTTLKTASITKVASSFELDVSFENPNLFKYYRILVSNSSSGYGIGQWNRLQFYTDEKEITENQSAMSYIGLNNYCANTLIADSDWLEGISNSNYIDSVLNVKVPTMTSDNTPSGQVINQNISNAYYAFDGNTSTNTKASNEDVYPAIGYTFTKKICVKFIKIIGQCPGQAFNVKFQVHRNNVTWEDLKTFTLPLGDSTTTMIIDTNSYYEQSYRILSTTKKVRGTDLFMKEIQFYGREE